MQPLRTRSSVGFYYFLTPNTCDLFKPFPYFYRYEALYGARVSRRKCCDLIPYNLPVTAFNPGHNLTQRFRRQLEYWPNVKWLYFITAEGLHTEFPAHNFRAATVASSLVESIALATAATAAATNVNAGSGPLAVSSSQQASPWQSPAVEGSQRQRRHLPPSLLTALYDCRSVHQLRHRYGSNVKNTCINMKCAKIFISLRLKILSVLEPRIPVPL